MFVYSDMSNILSSQMFLRSEFRYGVRYDFRIQTMFGSSLPSVVCRMAHILVSNISDYASTMTGVLLVAGTVCPPLTHGFTPSFLVGSVLLMFLVFCVVFLFRLSSSILCCPFGFQPHRWCTGSVLSSSVVGRGFEPRSGQIKDYRIGICCFSAQHVALRKKSRLIGSESG